jgi:hypothetical protein
MQEVNKEDSTRIKVKEDNRQDVSRGGKNEIEEEMVRSWNLSKCVRNSIAVRIHSLKEYEI